MQKDEQGAVLTLPQPGGEESGDVHLVPVSTERMPLAVRRQK
jgi:general secretion pathway protein N